MATPGTRETATAPTDLGERFARSVAAQDADALKRLLTPAVVLRATTPGRQWACHGADAVVDDVVLGTWFPSPECSITEVLAVDRGRVGPVERVGYRFRTSHPDGDYLVEQQAYLTIDDARISRVHVLCSGFVRDV